eukprot:GHRR01017615.1.p1 GENE.GHRR01017615.1~~GHRR01017615.1.p1  ORF type:complete len:271 (-),score=57.63 GHRR01017615.1:534-1346(-)
MTGEPSHGFNVPAAPVYLASWASGCCLFGPCLAPLDPCCWLKPPRYAGHVTSRAEVTGALLGLLITRKHWRLRKSHTRALPSSLPETSCSPSGVTARLLTAFVCPSKQQLPGPPTIPALLPAAAAAGPAAGAAVVCPTKDTSHILPSTQPASSTCSPASSVAAVTPAGSVRARSCLPVDTAHSLIDLSSEAVTSRALSSPMPRYRDVTGRVCSDHVCRGSTWAAVPVSLKCRSCCASSTSASSHARTSVSSPADIRSSPVSENTRALTAL